MAKVCTLCGVNTIFFVWTTSRNFNVEKYLSLKNIHGKQAIREFRASGHPVCLTCFHKHNLENVTITIDDPVKRKREEQNARELYNWVSGDKKQ